MLNSFVIKKLTDISHVEMEERECIHPRCFLTFKVKKGSKQKSCSQFHSDNKRHWETPGRIYTENYKRRD